jgi:hypothetical protein
MGGPNFFSQESVDISETEVLLKMLVSQVLNMLVHATVRFATQNLGAMSTGEKKVVRFIRSQINLTDLQ